MSHRSRSIQPRKPGGVTTRREFLGALGATTALPLVMALPAAAQSPPPAPATPPAAPPAATPNEVDPEVAADASSLLEMVQRRFGSRLEPAQLELIRQDLQDVVGSGRTLRK